MQTQSNNEQIQNPTRLMANEKAVPVIISAYLRFLTHLRASSGGETAYRQKLYTHTLAPQCRKR